MVLGSRIEGGAQVLSAGMLKTIQSIKEIVGNHSDADIYMTLTETNMDPNETAQKLLNLVLKDSRIEGGTQVLSAGVRKTIQSIKEIVGNHSDADIYMTLKETNMDPNETTQKLLNQDPFHEVKRKRDRKKENFGYKSFVSPEPRKNTELGLIPLPMKYNANSDHTARSGGFSRNFDSYLGAGQEFRVVRDNRVNQNASADPKLARISTSTSKGVISNSNQAGTFGHQKPPIGLSSQSLNVIAYKNPRQTKIVTSGGSDRNESLVEKRLPTPPDASYVQTKTNDPQVHSTKSSNSSTVGVYSSSSDPVHVPPLNSRAAANVGAIKREVGVVGPRRQPSKNFAKPSSSQNTPSAKMQSEQEGHSRESTRMVSGTKSDQPSKNVPSESVMPGQSTSRSVSSNHHSNMPHQLPGHQKAPQPSKKWKPKPSYKPSSGVIGTPAKTVSPPTENPEDLKKEAAQMQDNMSHMNISDNQNVIIAEHIRVSEADRCKLTFGSLGTDLDSTISPVFTANESAEELLTVPSGSVSVSGPESFEDEPAGSKQSEILDDSIRSSGCNSPATNALSDHQLAENKVSSNPHNMDNYADVQLVRDNSQSYTPELLQQQDTSEMPSFSGYDPQMAYNMPYFQPMVDETGRGSGLSSSQEVLSSHTTSAVPASTIAMVQQQQQQQLAQMYPHLHISHFANMMPYRQFYGSPMHMPGYSNNPAYPHPSNGSSYLLMPGNNSHLTPGGLKYGIQQFKPVPTGSPTGFGNFTSPTGYTMNTPGVLGNTTGHEDPSRNKYKDSHYIPNPQADTSEIWMNPRDMPNVQTASYYNMLGQTPHAYLPSHNSHASFNAAAQSSHMQVPGMYHQPQQPRAIPSAHHLAPVLGGNVGVGPAPGPQVGAYQQQPQMGHLNWAGNF